MKKIRIVALVAAILTFMCAYLLMRTPGDGTSSSSHSGGEKMSVVVVKQDVHPYTVLTEEMLSVEERELDSTVSYVSTLEDAVGKVTVSDIYAGEALTAKRVVASDDTSLGLTSKIESGKRAITIMVDAEQAVGYQLKVGNYVDVLYRGQADVGTVNGTKIPAGVAFTSAYGAENPKNSAVLQENFGDFFSVITVQNVKVLALENLSYFSGENTGTEYAHVTLEVTPAQAEDIALMNDATGWIQLILRAQDDDKILEEPRHAVLGK